MATSERVHQGVGTSRTLRAHWALLHLNLPYRTEAIRTRSPEAASARYQAVTVLARCQPCRTALTVSSAAIVTYLGEAYDSDQAPLVPRTPAARARYFEWLSFITMELDATSFTCCGAITACPRFMATRPGQVAQEYFIRMATVAADRFRPPESLLLSGLGGVDILMMTAWMGGPLPLGPPPRLAAYRDTVAAMPLKHAR